MEIKIGDIVTRDGTDKQLVYAVMEGGDLISVICIKEPECLKGYSPWIKIGETEDNLTRRYKKIKHTDIINELRNYRLITQSRDMIFGNVEMKKEIHFHYKKIAQSQNYSNDKKDKNLLSWLEIIYLRFCETFAETENKKQIEKAFELAAAIIAMIEDIDNYDIP